MEEIFEPAGTVTHLLIESFLDHHYKLTQVQKAYKKLKDKKKPNRLSVEYDLLVFPTVIGATLILEAYINEYGANGLGRYFDKYLDRLDLLSKWAVIPQLVEGVNLDEHPRILSRISTLISARNRLVHPKLSWIPKDSDKAKIKWKKMANQWNQLGSIAIDSIFIVRDVAAFMNKHCKNSDWAIAIYGMTNNQIKKY